VIPPANTPMFIPCADQQRAAENSFWNPAIGLWVEPNPEYVVGYGLAAMYQQVAAAMCNASGFIAAAEAAIRYDEAIQSCVGDPDRMSSYCTAEGDDLDALYADWIGKSRAVLAKIKGDIK